MKYLFSLLCFLYSTVIYSQRIEAESVLPNEAALKVISSNGIGASIKGGDSKPTIELRGSNWFNGGDDGVIQSDTTLAGSDIFIVANDAVIVEINNNDHATDKGQFEIWKGSTNELLFRLDEEGNLYTKGRVRSKKLRHFPFSAFRYEVDPPNVTEGNHGVNFSSISFDIFVSMIRPVDWDGTSDVIVTVYLTPYQIDNFGNLSLAYNGNSHDVGEQQTGATPLAGAPYLVNLNSQNNKLIKLSFNFAATRFQKEKWWFNIRQNLADNFRGRLTVSDVLIEYN